MKGNEKRDRERERVRERVKERERDRERKKWKKRGRKKMDQTVFNRASTAHSNIATERDYLINR
jgi:hypothetical protein